MPSNLVASKTVTKSDLVDRVHQDVGCSKKDAGESVDALLEILKSSLQTGHKVKISGFGSFLVRQKNPRRGRNPQTDSQITIEARKVLTFKPSQILRAAINDSVAEGSDT